ncbi:hypothetical protein HYH03_013563 [Edaphochlamys debaryana]|uniref:Glycosyltransferase family 32 protein n=1 Tax=Edaphochlamys debaryana TaxID=47281 RepID=A0A835XPV0_9CHLO|nr:hypothetical protein HYH03_013563 [Edaphochlamys debaryana]|eukprot:KAG2487846.1 hypothetical protein HYH03_013563 [Edaphochlamys debaryana]
MSRASEGLSKSALAALVAVVVAPLAWFAGRGTQPAFSGGHLAVAVGSSITTRDFPLAEDLALLRARQNVSFCNDAQHNFVVSDPCVEDALLGNSSASPRCRFAELRQAASEGPWAVLRERRVYFAITLNAKLEVMPTFFSVFLSLALTLREVFGASVFVSIYEAGSGISAYQLAQSLKRLEVGHEVVVHRHVGHAHEHRVELQARVRNQLLQHLVAGDRGDFDTVLFLTDAFFCAQGALDALALVREGGADMACGADFAYDHRGDLSFADIWATRDVTGRKFSHLAPIVPHAPSWRRFEAGRPTPAFSCWASLTALAADLFTARRLRFRRSLPTECAASDAELLCRDMAAANRSRVLVLPSAVAAGGMDAFQAAHWRYAAPDDEEDGGEGGGGEGLGGVGDAGGSGGAFPMLDLPPRADPPASVECCPLEDPCEAVVDFSACVEDPVAWFYTAYGGPPTAAPGALHPVRPPGPLDPARASMKQLVAALRPPGKCPERGERRIPRRIVQFWRTSRPAEIRQHVWFGMLSWVLQHPCHEYVLATEADIDSLLREAAHPLHWKWAEMTVQGMKQDFGRYLYMQAVGGVFADTDTVALRPLDPLLEGEGEGEGPQGGKGGPGFVAGLEAAFESGADAELWGYPEQLLASAHCWAAEPGSEVVGAIVRELDERITNPREVYKRIVALGRGSPAVLEVQFTTGVVPFTAVVTKAAREGKARLLPLPALQGGHPAGAAFYDLQYPGHMGEGTVYVQHRPYGSWTPKGHVHGAEPAFFYLPANRPLLTDEWFYAADLFPLLGPTGAALGLTGAALGPTGARPLWTSPYEGPLSITDRRSSLQGRQGGEQGQAGAEELGGAGEAEGGQRAAGERRLLQEDGGDPFNRTGMYFVWMTPTDTLDVACLQIFKGWGPRDQGVHAPVWRACWNAFDQGSSTYAWLHPDGQLSVYTTARSWCGCQQPEEPKVLWSAPVRSRGAPAPSPAPAAPSSVLLLSREGSMSVVQFPSPYALNNALASLGHALTGERLAPMGLTSSAMSSWSLVLDARGTCAAGKEVRPAAGSGSGSATVPVSGSGSAAAGLLSGSAATALEEAMRLCEADTACDAFTLALPQPDPDPDLDLDPAASAHGQEDGEQRGGGDPKGEEEGEEEAGGSGLAMCAEPMAWRSAPHWVTVTRHLPTAASGGSGAVRPGSGSGSGSGSGPASSGSRSSASGRLLGCYVGNIDARCRAHTSEWERLQMRMRTC